MAVFKPGIGATFAGAVTITSGGIAVTGNSSITGTLTVSSFIRNDGTATGFALGGVASVQRIQYDALTGFNFLTAVNGSAGLVAGIVTAGGSRPYKATGASNAAAANTGTLTNSPTAGNPGFWLPVNINGTDYCIPCWVG